MTRRARINAYGHWRRAISATRLAEAIMLHHPNLPARDALRVACDHERARLGDAVDVINRRNFRAMLRRAGGDR